MSSVPSSLSRQESNSLVVVVGGGGGGSAADSVSASESIVATPSYQPLAANNCNNNNIVYSTFNEFYKFAPIAFEQGSKKGFLIESDKDKHYFSLFGNILYIFDKFDVQSLSNILFIESSTIKKIQNLVPTSNALSVISANGGIGYISNNINSNSSSISISSGSSGGVGSSSSSNMAAATSYGISILIVSLYILFHDNKIVL